jgi:NAD(P)-dependent dehydrogenase (short-subunit alcohol dehydrogenase family)
VKEFKGKVAVITGGASGLGLAIAHRAAKEGMKLVLADIEQAALTKAEDELKRAGAEVIGVKTDVSKAADVEALAKKTLDAFGKVHLVCNNAGVGGIRLKTWEASLEDWQWVLGVNVWGVIHGVRTFTPIMLAQDEPCHMVNTASVAGLLSPSGMSVYNVSKHAVVALSETMFQDLALAKAKLQVSVLCPAFVSTGIWNSARNRPKELSAGIDAAEEKRRAEEVKAVLDKGRLTAADVANMVFAAIEAEKFYIITHAKIKGPVEIRMQDILLDRNPTFTN